MGSFFHIVCTDITRRASSGFRYYCRFKRINEGLNYSIVYCSYCSMTALKMDSTIYSTRKCYPPVLDSVHSRYLDGSPDYAW